MRIVHLADLGPTGPARSLSRLAPVLAADGVEQTVINLGRDEPFAADLLAANVPVRTLRFRDGFDLSRGVELRRLVERLQPDVVHVWGDRAAVLANWLRLSLLDSHSIPVVVCGVRSGGRWVSRTLAAAKTVRDAPLLSADYHLAPLRAADFGLPSDARLVVNVTDSVHRSDPTEVFTAFDILKHSVPGVYLLVIGDGSGRDRIEQLNRRISFDDNKIRFLGVRRDVPAILAAADAVVISHRDGKRTLAAEAVTAGQPVVAYDTPDLATILRHDENAVLVPAGNAHLLAKGLFRVLTEPAFAAKLSASPRTVAGAISPAAAAREWQEIYRHAAGC